MWVYCEYIKEAVIDSSYNNNMYIVLLMLQYAKSDYSAQLLWKNLEKEIITFDTNLLD